MSEKQQRLVFSIIEFLNQSIDDGTVKADDKESLEVAVQCIGEAFGVDPSNQEQVEKLSVKPATLRSIFDVYMKTRDNFGARAQASASSFVDASSSSSKSPTAEDKEKAEKLKQEGNILMTAKKYDEAIETYTKAIALDGTNPVYYSNRAAAYSSKGDHLSAIGDANKAIEMNPEFLKGYNRLGHAQYSLGDFKAAAEAFEGGLKVDPSNLGLKSSLASAKAKIASENDVSPRSTPAAGVDTGPGAGAGGLGGLADMFRNMGGDGGGGMPDIASLMNNPTVMSMIQQMAQSGGLDRLMQDPSVANMMNRVSSGDMPSMEELMANPEFRNMYAAVL
ncbi:Small glutamine-rich tetratricopeptide repeat-containing protein 2 [Leucoagaricus sp. SymC.cos]|nr:Small glutamine-rich tetratricopeptide repeat-containing protein 2 [Leucoagaricus sp. SymC.cos]